MPTLTPIRRQIVIRLHHQGPLDHYQIAADLGEPPWRIRHQLQALRLDRITNYSLTRTSVLWRLTEKGLKIAAAAAAGEQLELTQ